MFKEKKTFKYLTSVAEYWKESFSVLDYVNNLFRATFLIRSSGTCLTALKLHSGGFQ